jgi:xanthine/uracil permease
MKRWTTVGAIGVLCGLVLGWLLWSLVSVPDRNSIKRGSWVSLF